MLILLFITLVAAQKPCDKEKIKYEEKKFYDFPSHKEFHKYGWNEPGKDNCNWPKYYPPKIIRGRTKIFVRPPKIVVSPPTVRVSPVVRPEKKVTIIEKHAPQYHVETKVAAPVYILPKHGPVYSHRQRPAPTPRIVVKAPKVIVKPTPIRIRPAPVFVRPPPVFVRPPRVIVKPTPVFVRPPPIDIKPAPTFVRPAPVVIKPKPVFVKPTVIDVRPRPVFVRPPPVFVKPQPTLVKPSTVFVKPGPVDIDFGSYDKWMKPHFNHKIHFEKQVHDF